jgi:transketolase
MRKAFSETLYQMAVADPRLVFLTGDLGFQLFDQFSADFKERFINVGVAEAQMMSAAAGLAMAGWHPIAYSIASFATGRPFEQIRYCIGYPHLPVMIVGAGRGFTYSTSGVSHHALDDIALMSAIPGMTVVIPGDEQELRQLMPQLGQLTGPSYFTIGRYGEPKYAGAEPATLGKARLLRGGDTVAFFSVGEIAYEVVQAVDLLRTQGLSAAAYQMHTVKPLDTATLASAAQTAHTFIVVDEHLPGGSLWSQIADWKATTDSPVRLRRLGPPDKFALGNLRREDLRQRLGYDAAAIAVAGQAAWKN